MDEMAFFPHFLPVCSIMYESVDAEEDLALSIKWAIANNGSQKWQF